MPTLGKNLPTSGKKSSSLAWWSGLSRNVRILIAFGIALLVVGAAVGGGVGGSLAKKNSSQVQNLIPTQCTALCTSILQVYPDGGSCTTASCWAQVCTQTKYVSVSSVMAVMRYGFLQR